MKSKFMRLLATAATLAVMGVGAAQADTVTPASSSESVLSGVSAGASGQVNGAAQAGTAAASDLVVNLAGIRSYDGLNKPINTVLTLNAQAGSTVSALSWNLTLSTIGDSWLADAAFFISNSAGDGVFITPGYGDEWTGVATYSARQALNGLSFKVLSDGVLNVQFFENYDDNPGAADTVYTAGSLTLEGIAAAVPEPASHGLMALGLLALGAAARRRKN